MKRAMEYTLISSSETEILFSYRKTTERREDPFHSNMALGSNLSCATHLLLIFTSGIRWLSLRATTCGGEGSGWWRITHKKKEAEEFLYNGARLLEESVASFEGSGNKPIRMFSSAELKKATNNYAHILAHDSCIYKGTHEGRTIAVKNPNLNRYGLEAQYVEESINEAVVLSHVYHRNVVKLFGCCIETEIPILVFEFLSDGTLYHRLRDPDPSTWISWENRLRIATEIAYGLAYLHTATSRPIVHRDIKSSKILLDENYTSKITGLGLSIRIPLGETHVETRVRGTVWYLDPMYMFTGEITAKSDVYSFGLVLLELLAGNKALTKYEDDGRTLLSDLISEAKGIDYVLEANNMEEVKRDQLIACRVIALRCIKNKGEERPTMKEVVEELTRIKWSEHF